MVERIITCGMYSFTDELKLAWQQLFNILIELLDAGSDREISLRFDSDQSLLCDPALFFGHTCGYPLMIHLKNRLSPFCAPIFDVPGTEGKLYSSRFIVGANSGIALLDNCRDKVAAINAPDSNSGMNVLRYAISNLNPAGQFFSRVITTGSHLHSLEAVVSQQADIAAIDCVSYQLIEDCRPDLVDQVRSIGFSIKTCGLPLVIPGSDSTDTEKLIDNLNRALALAPATVRERLHLLSFEPVALGDYQGIVDIENHAVESGYPLLV
ncbi:MAG: PhnD/SsuA/transferrin family substrate-binding protein [Gammaproteobacteria bacterium]|nr:PhnD/SsuA/transferrin family substrate-binding protein [Gammaproteobacteria bacterium]MDH3859271.1 PhnD/SsuA/transferrin family substrate-binding protein [Gammaproteobacteria bacterium]